MADLTPQAETIAKKRYYLKDEAGETVEDSTDMFKRVAKTVALIEQLYDKPDHEVTKITNQFFEMMDGLKFIPNSPTMMNAGTHQGTLSACFVLPLEDTMEGIMKGATDAAMVQKFGGGTGFALSKLRPRGTNIASTHGKACGPIEVLKTLSRVSSMITQGGKRDGANMAILDVHHPDILEFISCKSVEGDIHNFNISVGVDNSFMQAVAAGVHYPLIDPNTHEVVGEHDARMVFDTITKGAWKNGEPGMVFLDRINQDNKVKEQYGDMIATNPCGEQPLLGNESCNLGSVNLAEFHNFSESTNWKDSVDWEDLASVIKLSTRFLDNVIDANYYATPEIEKMTKSTRKIGLGVMGFADLLIKLKIGYDTKIGREVGATVMEFIQTTSDDTSIELAEERGVFPAWDRSDYAKEGGPKYRNACRLTVAPTGTISMLADTSSGIEPTFALVWRKQNVLEGQEFFYANKYFKNTAKDSGFYSEDLMGYVADGGSIQDRDDVPQWAKDVFVTSADIGAEGHVGMQSAFQKYCDSGISKTINFPNSATVEDISTAYIEAWRTGCKGITVYRSGSRDKEVLVSNVKEETKTESFDLSQLSMIPSMASSVDNEFKLESLYTDSPSSLKWLGLSITEEECCSSPFIVEESGCSTCKSCGWSKCHIA
jgi:ribonucleoside-diphosphate reductase alpha chain